MRNTNWKFVPVILLMTAFACANPTSPAASPSPTRTDPPTDLATARDAWAAANVGSYALQIKTQCFCALQDYRVVIGDDGSVQKAAPEDYLPETVDDLFSSIQAGYDENAAEVRVTYSEIGVPLDVFIDQSRTMADEEIGYKVAFEDVS
ncbi:MAG: DUF6174 domain-containing protein [Actinomycetota bacterium]